MPKTSIATKSVAEDRSGVTFSFAGQDEPLVLSLSDLSEEMVINLALHGLSQKAGDSYSGEKDPVVARSKVGTGRISDLAAALARATGKTIEQAVAVLSDLQAKDPDNWPTVRSQLRKHKQIKLALEEIRVEKARKALEESGPEQDLSALGL